MNAFKGLETNNYEAETFGIDNLLTELKGPTYAPYVIILGIEKHVTNLEIEATKFKAIFNDRSIKTISTEVYNAKKLRKEIFSVYNQLVDYVVSTGKINNNEFYSKSLVAINNGRKYFGDILAKRAGVAESKKTN